MKKLHSLDHGTKEYFTPSIEQMDVISERFPWLGRYDIEIGNSLKKHLTSLLCFAIIENDEFLIKSILEKYHFDRESLNKRVIRDIKKIDVLCVDRYKKMLIRIQPAGEDAFEAEYLCGGNCVVKDRMRRYLSAEAALKLRDFLSETLSIIEDARNERSGFRKAGYPQGLRCYRPLPKESACGRCRYEYIFIGNNGCVSFSNFHCFSRCSGAFGSNDEKEKLAAMITAGTEPLYQTAVKYGDIYLMYSLKEECGLITEDECEYLSKTDGLLHTVNRRTSETASSVYVKKAEFRRPGFFSPWSGYYCDVVIDGNEYQTTWEPAHPDRITILNYHHYADYHLTEDQIEEFWKKTDADPDSNPIGRPRSWKLK